MKRPTEPTLSYQSRGGTVKLVRDTGQLSFTTSRLREADKVRKEEVQSRREYWDFKVSE